MATVVSAFRRHLPARRIDLVLILVILLVGWVVARDVFHAGRPEREWGEESREVTLALTTGKLGQADWRVGTLALGAQGTVYEARIVDIAGRELFKLRVDASTGKLLGKGEKPSFEATSQQLSAAKIKSSLEPLLDDLSLGQAQQKGKEAFAEVPLTYQGREVARTRVDPLSGQVVPQGQEDVRGQAEKAGAKEEPQKGEEKEGKEKLIPRNLVAPLGWGSALIMIVGSLYYSWKRSLYSPLRAAGGEAKARAVAQLRRTLWWHTVVGVAAVAVAVLHALNFTAKLQLSVSWLTLGMAIVVAASGAFGRFMARSEAVRSNWRRFHVPYTILFFIVLFIHVLEKTKVLGD